MADVVYTADLDDEAVQAALKNIVQNTKRTAEAADRAWGKVDKGASASGISIGLTSGFVQELTGRFIDLGIRAVETFGRLTKESISLNAEMELLEISATQIFGGNEKAAQAFIERMKQLSIQLGVSRSELTQLAKGVLPDIGSVDLTEQFTTAITVLGKDAGQYFTSIRIAAEEALSGNLSSLQRRLNIPKSTIDSIKEYQKEFGDVEGLIKGLQERVETTGLSVESTAQSLSVLMGQARGAGEEMLLLFGEAPSDELKEQITATLEVFENNRDDIEAVVKSFGDLAAKVIEFVGGGLRELIDNLDYKQLEQVGDNFVKLVDQAQLLAEILFDPNLLNNILDGANSILELLNQALETGAQLAALAKAKEAQQIAEGEKAAEIAGFGVKLGPSQEKLSIAPFVPRSLGLLSDEDEAAIAAAGQAAYNAEIEKSIEKFDRYNQRQEDAKKAQDERRQSQEETTDADNEAGEAYLRQVKMLEELEKAQGEAAEAQDKINEKTEKFAKESSQRITKILRDQENTRIEDAIKAAEKRADIARKNLDKIEDINRDHARDIEDLALELPEKEAKLARESARDRLNIERDKNKSILDAEKAYQDELRRIQETFNQAALDAERNNDVQAFLQAQRAAQQSQREAERSKEDEIEDVKSTAKERREELKAELEQEIADAKEANQKKLDDLNKSLERRLEDQRIALERQEREQEIAEERNNARRQRQFAQEIEEFKIKEQQKLEALNESLEKEFALIEAYNEKKIEAAKSTAKSIADEAKKILGAFNLKDKESGPTAETGLYLPGFQHGGRTPANQPFLVGENGPEVMEFPYQSRVYPSVSDYINQPQSSSGYNQQIFNDNRQSQISMPVQESIVDNPIAKALFKQLAREVIAETL